jgi:hypothetical protein
MPVCPSCNLQTSGPRSLFCAHCGFALPDGSACSEETPVAAAPEGRLALNVFAARRWRPPSVSPAADPRAVAVGLGALAIAVVVSVWLSYGPGSKPAKRGTPLPAVSGRVGGREALSRARPSASVERYPAGANVKHYRAGDYSFAYPSAWRVRQSERPVTNYRETVLERADGAAKVTIDYSPGERADPAAKALQVEAPTSASRGYRQIAFRPTSVRGHPAFVWEFEVADAYPRRIDLFLRTSSGAFAVLAYGSDLEAATSAARLIAGSLSGVR